MPLSGKKHPNPCVECIVKMICLNSCPDHIIHIKEILDEYEIYDLLPYNVAHGTRKYKNHTFKLFPSNHSVTEVHFKNGSIFRIQYGGKFWKKI